MPPDLPKGPPFWQRLIVGTAAVGLGVYAFLDALKEFELIKFTPFSEEEIAQRKLENRKLSIRQLEQVTLDYTPEAKEKFRKRAEQLEKEKGS